MTFGSSEGLAAALAYAATDPVDGVPFGLLRGLVCFIIRQLRQHLGATYPLVKVKDRLRCEQCASRAVVITFLAPNQKTAHVAYPFGESLRR
jgi:hypothetical protein